MTYLHIERRNLPCVFLEVVFKWGGCEMGGCGVPGSWREGLPEGAGGTEQRGWASIAPLAVLTT